MVERAGTGVGPKPSFDVGLERITRAEPGGSSGLPEMDAILPSRLGLPDELARVLPDSRLKAVLEGFLNPDVAPELLMPGRFATAFDGLRRRVERDRRRDPEIAAALELLEDERASRDLLDYYRTVLLGA